MRSFRSRPQGGGAEGADITASPFRPLGAVAVLPPRKEGLRSPSGLLTERGWEAAERPAPCAPVGERDRAFARWVHAEAKTLASRLERLLRPEAEAALSRHLRAVVDGLWADADWARQRLDGRFDDPT